MILAAAMGVINFRQLDRAMRMIAILLLITTVSESLSYLAVVKGENILKNITYHVYNIIQCFLIAAFFIYAIKPPHQRKLLVLSAVLCPAAGIVNLLFLQPVDVLDSNMLMAQSLFFITLSLYFIYRVMKDERVENVFRHPHFQIALIWLVESSSTIFFWACIRILYQNHWSHLNILFSAQLIIETLVYLAIATTFYLYKPITTWNEQH